MSEQLERTAVSAGPALRHGIAGAVATLVLTLVSIAYIDRPVARFMAIHVHHRLPFIAMAAIANLPSPLATIALIGIVIANWCGVALNRTSRLVLAIAVATLVAIMIKNQLKFDFGRVWPQSHPFPGIYDHPSYLNDHVFGFFPFHGGSSYASFPSGHTTAITAPMAMLWVLAPRYRPLWGSAIVMVIIGLIAADFHFVSDTIAGFALGVTVAAGAVSLTAGWIAQGGRR
ncbi:phosphatase PAP2 family protein [Acidiphilium sp. PA]|uniref:phosphatase PAP2 family protein n=1 Tax=Acidiphilium sp. PA TaxID=2871705 RepID=UPI0022442EB9|nr:phosphatase PAP2 family protein [Acidiphilium sp. PA]MCW8308616.1 phosphatase PAP2 family protein [Acidiphilium sp. PA]